jgi:protein-S-isoprenylcysteine O-methyltransferase Ste14
MADDPRQPSTQMPWPLRIWPLAVMAVAVTTALVLLAVLIDSDVSRVALPVIAGAVGTIAVAVTGLEPVTGAPSALRRVSPGGAAELTCATTSPYGSCRRDQKKR